MYHTISPDVKIAAIRLYERARLDLEEILDSCNISRSTFFRALKLYRTTGDVENARQVDRSVRALDYDDIHYLRQLIHDNPDHFLDELSHLLKTNRFISVHYTTIYNELLRAGITRKRLKRIAAERNEGLRAEFIARMAQYDPEELGFIDEVSKDERTVGRRYG